MTFWCIYCQLWTFTRFFSVSIIDFEQVKCQLGFLHFFEYWLEKDISPNEGGNIVKRFGNICNMNYRYVLFKLHHYPANKYMVRVSNRNTRKSCEICSKLTIKTPERRRIYFTPFSSVSIVNLKQTNIFWDKPFHLLLCYLTFSSPCIFKSCSKIKINLNFYFHTSL